MPFSRSHESNHLVMPVGAEAPVPSGSLIRSAQRNTVVSEGPRWGAVSARGGETAFHGRYLTGATPCSG